MIFLPAFLSAVHVLALGLGLCAVVIRGQALRGPLDGAGWRKVLAADSAWGVAAGIWILSGVARVFWGDKQPDYYWHNGFFWVKLALFAVVFGLEMAPMMAFMRVRRALASRAPLPNVPVGRIRRVNSLEIVLVVVIPFVAAFMARGFWLF
jgi:putative membrane protein